MTLAQSLNFEFFFDVASPASYIAYRRLRRSNQLLSERISWRPILLGAIIQATGNQPPTAISSKRNWFERDMAETAARHGVEFVWSPRFPMNSLYAMRVVQAALSENRNFFEVTDRLMKAAWVETADLSDLESCETALAGLGPGASKIIEAASTESVKLALRASTNDAVASGVFGAPTMRVGETFFFGQDRLDRAVDFLLANGRHSVLPRQEWESE